MFKLRNIVGILLAMTCSGNVVAAIDLVRDGEPLAEIVVAKDAPSGVNLAAADLQNFIRLMSGATLPINNTRSPNVPSHVYVGKSAYTDELGITADDLISGGFRIVAADNHLVLIGHDNQHPPRPYSSRGESLKQWQEFAGEKYSFPHSMECHNKKLGIFHDDETATLYAVSEFLEQQGIRWYHPYEDGTVIPEKKTISVPKQELVREPKFSYRYTTYYGAMRTDVEGLMWFKRLKYGVSHGVLIGHTVDNVLGYGAQMEDHPQYFAQVDGKLIKVPRITHPDFRRSSLNFLHKIIEAWPWLSVVNLQMTDGLGRIDDRDAEIWSQPDRGYLGKFSDYVWDYWLYIAAELKKTHPDILLRCNSYAPYAEPPLQIDRLPDNITLCIAQNTAVSFLPTEPSREIRRQWLPILNVNSNKLYLWDYYLFYRPGYPGYPVFFFQHLQNDMQELNGICAGKIIETWSIPGQRLACPGLAHMLHYLQGKLYWDPYLDLQALLSEYYELYFGPARDEMREFYEFAEAVWMRPETRSISTAGGFLKEEDVDRYFEILARARQKAGADTVYDRRIAEIETEMQALKTMFPMVRVGPELRGSRASEPLEIDGNLDKEFWKDGVTWYAMEEWRRKGPVPEGMETRVAFRLAPDGSALIVGVDCREPYMADVRIRAKGHDDFDIFEEDRIEFRIETPQRSYFKIAVNTEGTIWDETQDPTLVTRYTLPVLWNPGVRARTIRHPDRWTAEVVIPTDDFGDLGPSQEHPWGINVYRIRRVGGVREVYDLAPSADKLPNQLAKMGNLIVE